MTDLLTTTQAADRLGVSTRTLYRWVMAGRITPAQKLPGTGGYLFAPGDVIAPNSDEAA